MCHGVPNTYRTASGVCVCVCIGTMKNHHHLGNLIMFYFVQPSSANLSQSKSYILFPKDPGSPFLRMVSCNLNTGPCISEVKKFTPQSSSTDVRWARICRGPGWKKNHQLSRRVIMNISCQRQPQDVISRNTKSTRVVRASWSIPSAWRFGTRCQGFWRSKD